MRVKTRGFSLAEIIVVIAIIGILAMIAVPNMLTTRISTNESAATSLLGSIFSAAQSYRLSAGNLLPDSVADLQNATPPYGNFCTNVSDCRNSGYIFQISGTGIDADFFASAVPEAYGTAGKRKFCVTTDGVIRSLDDGNATPPTDVSACNTWTSLQ
ncbi:MAG: prepilin-type N-terminal cleavage/methylation domain-containing protein [Candidatus Omnitrophica bacterium]|jgi:prepilin-type N-terminal cleavage/methylation domain-containing protein|nr:prepilin-type N-terminal cleavage/methylation domain-containing protein [Candidatus Omnitrophota bacterium]